MVRRKEKTETVISQLWAHVHVSSVNQRIKGDKQADRQEEKWEGVTSLTTDGLQSPAALEELPDSREG